MLKHMLSQNNKKCVHREAHLAENSLWDSQ